MISLIGGGWQAAARPLVYGPFLEAAGSHPTVACVVFDEGDGEAQFERWSTALTGTAACAPAPVLIDPGHRLTVDALAGADALLVCGGLTPGYAEVLAPAEPEVAEWVAHHPYAGFSAGAAVAATVAVVGGWRDGDLAVCPEDAGEDLDQVTTAPGLGLVPFAVEVHCAQWGTLPRLIAAVRRGAVGRGIGVDEDTAIVDGRIAGLGAAYLVQAIDDFVAVSRFTDGQALPEEVWS